jgi:hypothetical protein
MGYRVVSKFSGLPTQGNSMKIPLGVTLIRSVKSQTKGDNMAFQSFTPITNVSVIAVGRFFDDIRRLGFTEPNSTL